MPFNISSPHNPSAWNSPLPTSLAQSSFWPHPPCWWTQLKLLSTESLPWPLLSSIPLPLSRVGRKKAERRPRKKQAGPLLPSSRLRNTSVTPLITLRGHFEFTSESLPGDSETMVDRNRFLFTFCTSALSLVPAYRLNARVFDWVNKWRVGKWISKICHWVHHTDFLKYKLKGYMDIVSQSFTGFFVAQMSYFF